VNAANPQQTSALDTALLGRTLDGRYAVQSRLAQGGMATVYRAWDNRLDRLVALKVMEPELALHREYVDRFIREAKSAAKLTHPNIVAVFDQSVLPAVGSAKGVKAMPALAYLAMEYVPGLTLRQLLGRRGRFTPREALEILDALLAGLAAAHRAGIVHRDVKPENVLLSEQALAQHGTFAAAVKVTDFGLARSMSADGAAATLGGALPGGGLLGTVSYLAPELVRNGSCDARSDVYSAGIVLFELLTGRKPFTGGTPLEIAHRHVSERVPAPSTLFPELDPALDALVTRATAREPESRPRDAAELRTQLRAVYTNLPATALDLGAHPDRPADRTVVLPVNQVIPDRTKLNLLGAGAVAANPGVGPVPVTAPVTTPAAAPRTVPLGHPNAAATQNIDHTRVDLNSAEPTRVGAEPIPAKALKIKPRTRADQPYQVVGPGTPKPSHKGRYILIGVVILALLTGAGAWYYGTTDFKKVPSLHGLTLSSAESEVGVAGLKYTVADDYSSSVQTGQVIGSSPGSGTPVKAGSVITIEVSKGPAPIPVPGVQSETQTQATADLTKAGFQVAIATATEPSATVPSGSVASYSPTGTALPGATITLTLSSGPPKTLVPPVTGLSVDAATKALTAAGFQVKKIGVQFFDDVYGQSPDGNTMAPTGSVVTIYYD